MRQEENNGKPPLLVVEDDLGLQKQLKWSLDEYQLLFATANRTGMHRLHRTDDGHAGW